VTSYVAAADARMKRIEENLDGLIRAISSEHSNGRQHWASTARMQEEFWNLMVCAFRQGGLGSAWRIVRPQWCAVSYRSRILCMPRGNPSPKLAITIDPDIHENILAAAARDRVSVSAWMTSAAREALQRRAGLAAVALWETQHGRLTAEEMNEARRNVRAQIRTSRTVRRPAWAP
jgi:hypothetical protein